MNDTPEVKNLLELIAKTPNSTSDFEFSRMCFLAISLERRLIKLQRYYASVCEQLLESR